MASFLQEIDGGADTAVNTTTRTATYTANISAGSVLLAVVGTYNGAQYLATVSDSKGNTWVQVGTADETNSGRGVAVYYAVANAASIGAKPIVSFVKSSNIAVNVAIFEVAGVNAAILDGAPVGLAANGTSTTASVTLPNSSYTDDIVMAALCTDSSPFVTVTPLSGYTASVANNGTPGSQLATIKRITTSTAAYVPGWTTSVAAHTAVVGFVLKGTTSTATITGISTLVANNGSVVISGLNFGASTGTVSFGGVAQTVTAWSPTSITFTVNRGPNQYGVALPLTITTAASQTSNIFSVTTGIVAQTGWAYVNLAAPNTTTAYRITAIADLALGDQLAYDTVGGSVVVLSDATFSLGMSVTAFNVEAWTATTGWGASATQSIPSSSDTGTGVATGSSTILGVARSLARAAGSSSGSSIATALVGTTQSGVGSSSGSSTAVAFGTGTSRYARPIGDLVTGAWVPSSGTSLAAMLNEVTPDSNTYISTTSAATCDIALNPVTPPSGGLAQVVSYQIWSANGNTLTVKLKQNTTVIATWVHTGVPTTPTVFAQTLTAPQVASITDYNSLNIEFTAS